MTTSPTKDGVVDVPAKVFENFLEALREANASPELIARLRKTLLEDKSFADHALKAAVFGEEPLP